jgi:hypothetical protein
MPYHIVNHDRVRSINANSKVQATAVNVNGLQSFPRPSAVVQSEESTPLLDQQKDQYSSFSVAQKTFIIFTAAFASTFSPFSANIYFPAMNSIAQDLHVTPAMMSYTITAYMVSRVTSTPM